MKVFAKILFWITLSLAIFLSFWLGIQHYRVRRDTIGWEYRAQIANNPQDMIHYLEKVENGMKKWNLTEGSANLIWHKPETNMELIMKTLSSVKERAKIVATFDITSTQYQVAMDDLRGILREFELYSVARWNVERWIINVVLILSWIGVVTLAILIWGEKLE